MARYYLFILLINTLFVLFVYFKIRNTGLSLRAFIFITGISISIGIGFPFLVGYFNLPVAVGICLLAVLAGSYHVAVTESNRQEQQVFGLIAASSEPQTYEGLETDEEMPDSLEETGVTGLTEPPQECGISAEELISADGAEEAEEAAVADGAETAEDTGIFSPSRNEYIQGDEIMGSQGNINTDTADLLNSYIMRGFDAKAADKPELAVKYFSSALDLEPPQDLSCMIVFDLYAILREIGRYQEAAECLEQFEKKYKASLTTEVQQEVRLNLKYLEILQEMLKKVNTPNLPFSKVPVLIRVRVEEKVLEWVNDPFA